MYGEVEVCLHAFLALAVDGESVASRSERFTLKERNWRLRVSPRTSVGIVVKPALPRKNFGRPAHSDWAILAHRVSGLQELYDKISRFARYFSRILCLADYEILHLYGTRSFFIVFTKASPLKPILKLFLRTQHLLWLSRFYGIRTSSVRSCPFTSFIRT